MYARTDTLPHTFDAGICTVCGETEEWVNGTARARHAGTVHGYARDMGAARKRLHAGKARYGKHGVYTPRRAGKAESMPVAVMRDWARAVKRRPLYGKRGVPATHPVALTLRVRSAQHKAA